MKKSSPCVLIRTDGSNEIGMGHVFRSITLAKDLKKQGCELHFLTSRNSQKFFKNLGQCHITNNNQETELSTIKKIKPSIFILDILKKFFNYSNEYFTNIRKFVRVCVAIDFVSPALKYFDMSFHSLFDPKKYHAKQTFYDLKYAIVNSEFKKISKKYKLKKNISKFLILRGGSDTKCIGPKILHSLQNFSSNVEIGIVLGPQFECWDKLNKEKLEFQNLKVFHNVKNMPNLMKNYQLAISAAGVTSTELLTIGIPTLIIYGDVHEKGTAELLNKQKVALNIGYGKTLSQKTIRESIKHLMNDYDLRKNMYRNSKKILDGNGSIRITTKILDYYALLKESEKFD